MDNCSRPTNKLTDCAMLPTQQVSSGKRGKPLRKHQKTKNNKKQKEQQENQGQPLWENHLRSAWTNPHLSVPRFTVPTPKLLAFPVDFPLTPRNMAVGQTPQPKFEALAHGKKPWTPSSPGSKFCLQKKPPGVPTWGTHLGYLGYRLQRGASHRGLEDLKREVAGHPSARGPRLGASARASRA